MQNDWAIQTLQAWADWQEGIMMPIPRVSLPAWNNLASHAARKYADETQIETEYRAFVQTGQDDGQMMIVDQVICSCSKTHKTVIKQKFIYGATHEKLAKILRTRKANIGNLIAESIEVFADKYLDKTTA